MIDIEKERETFSQIYRLKENGIAYFENVDRFAYEHKEREWDDIDYNFLVLIRKLWLTWVKCAESNQAEIDDLKAQINALEESRMNWREYAIKIESGEYELVKKAEAEKCVWRENEDGIWDTACGQDYVFDGYATQKPSDCGQYCSNCGKKIEDVSFEGNEDV